MTSYSVMFSFFMHDYYKKRGSYKRYGRRVHLLAFSLFLSFGLGWAESTFSAAFCL